MGRERLLSAEPGCCDVDGVADPPTVAAPEPSDATILCPVEAEVVVAVAGPVAADAELVLDLTVDPTTTRKSSECEDESKQNYAQSTKGKRTVGCEDSDANKEESRDDKRSSREQARGAARLVTATAQRPPCAGARIQQRGRWGHLQRRRPWLLHPTNQNAPHANGHVSRGVEAPQKRSRYNCQKGKERKKPWLRLWKLLDVPSLLVCFPCACRASSFLPLLFFSFSNFISRASWK